jgi:IQ calmodulin-binding motif
MNTFLSTRDGQSAAKRRLVEARVWIDDQNSSKTKHWVDLQAQHLAQEHAAALQMQTLYRGHIGRQLASERRARVVAVICVQRHWRGWLGCRIADELRWAKVSVVPTLHALQLMQARSKEVQQIGSWVEYYDTDTSGFWYLESSSGHSSWDAPDCFQNVLTCCWDPWPYPYSSPLDLPCRKVFKSHADFQVLRWSKSSIRLLCLLLATCVIWRDCIKCIAQTVRQS